LISNNNDDDDDDDYYYYYYQGYLYRARSLKAANELQSQLHFKRKCLQFASGHVQPNVWCS